MSENDKSKYEVEKNSVVVVVIARAAIIKNRLQLMKRRHLGQFIEAFLFKDISRTFRYQLEPMNR